MNISDKIQGAGQQVKESVRSSSLFLVHLFLRLLTGFFLGLTFGLIGQELMGYSTYGLLTLLVVTLFLFFRISKNWTIPQILIFDLICVLVGQILKMYILLAP